MSKDYVSRRRPTRQKPQTAKRLLTILTSFLCGYLVATVFDFTSLTTWVNKNVLNHKNPPLQLEVKATPVVRPKPKFEFYTLLSKDNSAPLTVNRSTPPPVVAARTGMQQPSVSAVSTATHATHQSTPPVLAAEKKPLSSANPVNKESYLIQMASFNKKQDAERLQASLVLNGFDVTISSIAQQNITWFRVNIGPFSSRIEAAKAQMTIARSEHMKGIIRRMDA